MGTVVEIRNEDGTLHSETGPAFVEKFEDGKENHFYYNNGLLHREDGPAMIFASGTKYWLQNGKLHREDGPAVEWSDGRIWFYINGAEKIIYI
jgi:hypothetical protein